MKELAVVVSNDNVGVTPIETIDAIKESGFKNVFVQWYNENLKISQEEQLKYIRQQGLNVIFAHLGYQGINSIWEEGAIGDSLVDRYISDIKICKQNDISMVIMHLTNKPKAPEYSEIGLNRIRTIVDYAKKLGIKVAFENTKIKGYFDYVLSNIDNDNVGICFDSGHYHAYFNDDFNFELYKNRIFAVHLHDNDKSDDLHLLPFDGSINWDLLISNLKNCNYNGPVTLELCYRYDYLNLSLTDFYKKGLEVAKEIADKFENDVI